MYTHAYNTWFMHRAKFSKSAQSSFSAQDSTKRFARIQIINNTGSTRNYRTLPVLPAVRVVRTLVVIYCFVFFRIFSFFKCIHLYAHMYFVRSVPSRHTSESWWLFKTIVKKKTVKTSTRRCPHARRQHALICSPTDAWVRTTRYNTRAKYTSVRSCRAQSACDMCTRNTHIPTLICSRNFRTLGRIVSMRLYKNNKINSVQPDLHFEKVLRYT